mmetsp:Transcript_54/g.109  ORF Transcript_54/g.109 Transcript_54/m.109 type:complete len:157 (+) Transcript_54:194-664(+)
MMIRLSHFTRVVVIPLLLVFHFSSIRISSAASPPFSTSSSIAFRQHQQQESVSPVIVGSLLLDNTLSIRGGGIIPGGWNPMGYRITKLGEQFLSFDGTLDTDIGRFISSLKRRKWKSTLKSEWLEILRASKSAQTMRIYRTLDDLLKFCLKAGFIN